MDITNINQGYLCILYYTRNIGIRRFLRISKNLGSYTQCDVSSRYLSFTKATDVRASAGFGDSRCLFHNYFNTDLFYSPNLGCTISTIHSNDVFINFVPFAVFLILGKMKVFY